MDIKTLGGPGLGELLKAAARVEQLTFRPATLADIRGLLEGAAQDRLQIGDIVKLRPYAANMHEFPKVDERCIVTQVLDAPYRSGDGGTMAAGRLADIALAMVDSDGDLSEFLYDSRRFEKVGSIYDPITLANGETVPVE